VPASPVSGPVTVPAVTIFANITIAGLTAGATAIAGPTRVPLGQSVSFAFSIKTDASDSLQDVLPIVTADAALRVPPERRPPYEDFR
jgi:hypothetical protein